WEVETLKVDFELKSRLLDRCEKIKQIAQDRKAD
ncbi:unnamed protein product, partial [marine sediment metagenome]